MRFFKRILKKKNEKKRFRCHVGVCRMLWPGLFYSVDILLIHNYTCVCVCSIVQFQRKLFPHTATLHATHTLAKLFFPLCITSTLHLLFMVAFFKVMVLHHFDEEKYKSKVIFSLINFIECTVFEIYFLNTHTKDC